MQGKDFIYFFFDENNNSLYAYGDTVLTTASLRPLEFTPDGWKKIQIQNQRNQTYFALDRSFTVPLDAVKDGGQILKYMYYTYGVEVKVYMAICEQRLFFDNTEYGFYYNLLYRGEVDFSNFKHDGTKVTVNLMEGGLPKLIKAYENTKYEIPVDVPQAVEILMDGIELNRTVTYAVLEIEMNPSEHTIGVVPIIEEGEYFGFLTGDSPLQDIDGFVIEEDEERWIFKDVDQIINIRLIGRLSVLFPCVGNSNPRYSAAFKNQRNENFYIINNDRPATGSDILVNYDFDITIPFVPGDKLFITGSMSVDGFCANMQYLSSTFEAKFTTRYKDTVIKALRPLYVFEQLVSKITDGTYVPQSAFLQSIEKTVVTCGDAIRGITDAVIKTSLRDFFTSYNSDFGIGMGMIADTLRLEDKAYWIDYTSPIDLGEVSKMRVSPASDLIVNNIKTGSPDQDYDDVNGKQEFNTTHEYSAPITRVTRDLNLISSYRKDSYGIEFTRINLAGKTTTDNDSDNDVFMIHIEDVPRVDGYYHLDRSLNPGATGLLTPSTVFNLFLTPSRALRRNGDYIRSLFYQLGNKFLTFQTTDKNDAVIAGGFREADSILISQFAPPLFSCNYLEFETKVPYNLFDILNANPLKAFTGTWAGFTFTGIPVKVSIAPGENASQTFQLLASPDTDLAQLVSIDG